MTDEDRKDKSRKDENPEYDRFQDLLKKVVSAPKEEVDTRREKYEREKGKRAG